MNPNRTLDNTKPRVISAEEQALDDALTNTFPASDPVSMLQPASADPEPLVVTEEVEARQGVTGHNVRYVLGYGLAGIVIAFAVMLLIHRS